MRARVCMTLCLILLGCGSAMAQPQPPSPQTGKTLVVGIKVAPPFVIADGDNYRGLAADLWKDMAADYGWQYTFKTFDLDGLLRAVEAGKVDVALGALTATAARERKLDFSHAITSSGLGVAVRNEGGSGWWAVAQALLSPAFLKVIGTLALLLLIVGYLVWLAEHRDNAEQFGGSRAQGIFSGFWWAMVTMTTVGYGDTAPRSVSGRILGMVWMLTALIVVSFFTASITSALTVGQLHSAIEKPSDLHRVRVASVAASTSGAWLERHHDQYVHVDSLDDALARLASRKVDAVVYDKPLLRWKIQQNHAGNLRVLPFTLERQDYAIALPTDSSLREPIDTALLQHINSSEWSSFVRGYLGSGE